MLTYRVAIIGAGFGGIGLAHALQQRGIDDYVIFEKSRDVGGVWLDNSYPGAACDVPSHLYSFSFAPKHDWSHKYAPQSEILSYLRQVAVRYGITSHVKLNTEVTSATYDEARALWTITTQQGVRYQASMLVSAVGQLSRPYLPALQGLEHFKGRAFHSARWDRTFDVRGKRVAMIGTGASAIQIVPAIQPQVEKLTLFQRSAAYVVPRNDHKYSDFEIRMMARVPALHTLSRGMIYGLLELRMIAFLYPKLFMPALEKQCAKHLASQVSDPELRRKLTPDYPPGCKRVLLSDDYFRALAQPNAHVITDAISHLDEHAIITRDGVRHDVDAIVFGTGFQATEFLTPIDIRGARNQALSDVWRDGAEAYLGVMVKGFPNFFMLYGPNTNLGHSSIVYMLESQIRYVMEMIDLLASERAAAAEVRADVQDEFNRGLQAKLGKMIWSGACTNWYKTESGKSTNNWPGYTFAYRAATRRLHAGDYVLTPKAAIVSDSRARKRYHELN